MDFLCVPGSCLASLSPDYRFNKTVLLGIIVEIAALPFTSHVTLEKSFDFLNLNFLPIKSGTEAISEILQSRQKNNACLADI